MIIAKPYDSWINFSPPGTPEVLSEDFPEKMEYMPIKSHKKTDICYWRSMPGRFEWRYDYDQTALLIDGSVELRMHGTPDLWPIDCGMGSTYHRYPIHFTAGTVVEWKVIKPAFMYYVNKNKGTVGGLITLLKHRLTVYAEKQMKDSVI